jgi:hypothetical protein
MKSNSRWLFVGIVLLALVPAALRASELAGDPEIYRSRMALLFAGELPYLDFFFEHLPVAVVPMAAAWLLGGAFGPVVYTTIFACLMALCLWLTLVLVERIAGPLRVVDPGRRWLAIAGPLMPIVLFRSDPLPVLLAMAGLYAIIEGRERLAITTEYAGILAKGWPVALALIEWRRGRRFRAMGLVIAATALMLALLSLPGFSQARQFSGIHSETLVGAGFTLARIGSGSSLGLINEAGATYVAVPIWGTVLNLSIGVVLLLLALYRVQPRHTWEGSIRLLAAAVVALLIGSPLLSPQFILWPTPFLALHPSRGVRLSALLTSLLTLLYMLGWNPGFEGDLWWVGVVNLRNSVLVVLGVMTALAVSGARMATDEPGRL